MLLLINQLAIRKVSLNFNLADSSLTSWYCQSATDTLNSKYHGDLI
jgi:hypothetical protein